MEGQGGREGGGEEETGNMLMLFLYSKYRQRYTEMCIMYMLGQISQLYTNGFHVHLPSV